MSHSNWQLESQQASLRGGALTAQLDLTHPGLGLHSLHVGPGAVRGPHVLGVQWGHDGHRASRTLSDCYVRGDDVIATYSETPERPYAPQVYWRAGGGSGATPFASLLELVVSVQTRLLDAQPEMTASTQLPAAEVLHLVDADEGRFESINQGQTPATLEPQDGAGCVLLRLAGSDLSYVEMVHPLDFIQGRLTVAASADTTLLTHTLIDCRMEKGVIIRTRVRGCFLDRVNDTSAALELHAAFAGSALPLSA